MQFDQEDDIVAEYNARMDQLLALDKGKSHVLETNLIFKLGFKALRLCFVCFHIWVESMLAPHA